MRIRLKGFCNHGADNTFVTWGLGPLNTSTICSNLLRVSKLVSTNSATISLVFPFCCKCVFPPTQHNEFNMFSI